MSRDSRIIRDVRRIKRPVGVYVVLATCVLVAALLLYRGYAFYSLDVDARVDHEDFRLLSPGEPVGHAYGIFGTALFAVNLMYIVRRRYPRLPIGSMRLWLNLHALTGLVGSLLVLFHSAFQLRSPVATVTAASLALVVVTGVIGRYLHALSPKVDLELQEANLLALDELVPGLGEEARAVVDSIPVLDIGGGAGLLEVLRTLPTWLRQARARRRRIMGLHRTSLSGLSHGERDLTRRALRRVANLAAAEARSMAASTLLRTWRGMHRILAILMLLLVTIHVAVAWFYGYRWVFSE